MHKLQASPFTSFSVDMNFRMLCELDGQTFRACRVVKHDLADVAYINRNDSIDSPYVIDDDKIEARDVYDALISIGLPSDQVMPFRGVADEDGFIDALGQVDERIQTYALALYETTGIVVPGSRYTLFDMGSDFESVLREAWTAGNYISILPSDT